MRKVGIDITKNSRFNDYINNTTKLNKILSQEEIKYLINVTSEKRKIEFICDFCNTTPTIINGSIRKLDKTNLTYIEPHKVIIKNITFLVKIRIIHIERFAEIL